MGKTSIIDHSLHYNCKKAIKSTAYIKLRILYFTYILGSSTKSHRYIHSKQITNTIRVQLMSSATPVPFLTFQPRIPSVRVLILDFYYQSTMPVLSWSNYFRSKTFTDWLFRFH